MASHDSDFQGDSVVLVSVLVNEYNSQVNERMNINKQN